MRVCVFSPDVAPLVDGAWRPQLEALAGSDAAFSLLTNSWAERPVGADIHVTGHASRPEMKIARKVLGATPRPLMPLQAACVAPMLRKVADGLIEGLRATDPDIVVSLHRGWAPLLRRRIEGTGERWPCVALGDAWPQVDSAWRHYDPRTTVSIVLPTYNGVRFLAEAIQSCLTQTHDALELIVVDDGSTAPVGAVVGAFSDPRLTYVRLEKNGGLPRALNQGFARATGDYCTWTSDDNFYAPDAIARMLAFLQTYRSVDFVYAESYRWDEEHERQPWEEAIIRTRPPESLRSDNYIGACFLYSRRVAQQVGDYSPKAALAEDYDYWVRVHRQFRMQRLLMPLYTYRFHGASLTAQHASEIAQTVNAVKRHHGVGARE